MQTPVRTYRPSSEDSLKANGQSRKFTTSQNSGNVSVNNRPYLTAPSLLLFTSTTVTLRDAAAC
eukprot:15048-Heterococcus_DN1.PRE.6